MTKEKKKSMFKNIPQKKVKEKDKNKEKLKKSQEEVLEFNID